MSVSTPLATRRLGSQGPELTTVGFGTWTIGGAAPVSMGATDDDESVAALRRAIEAGVNWVDTAPAYGLGHSEALVGRAVAPYRTGEDVYLFTKCGVPWDESAAMYRHDLTPATIRAECEASLRRLGVERIDLLQMHWPDFETGTPVEESWATLGARRAEQVDGWLGACGLELDEETLAEIDEALVETGAGHDDPPPTRI